MFQPFILFSAIFWVMIMLVLLKNNKISPGSDRSFTGFTATATPPVEITIFYWSGIWKSVAILILNWISKTPIRVKYPWKWLKGMKMLFERICNRLKYLLERQFFSLFTTLVKFFKTDYRVSFLLIELQKVSEMNLSSGPWLCCFFWRIIKSPRVTMSALHLEDQSLLHLQVLSPFFITRQFVNL